MLTEDGQQTMMTDDGHPMITIAHLQPMFQARILGGGGGGGGRKKRRKKALKMTS